MKTTKLRLILASTTTVAAIALTACGGGSDNDATPAIEGAWARTSPMSSENGAAYFKVTSDSSDAIVGASVDSAIAEEAQVHETSMVDEGEDGGDVMQMVEVGRLDLPAGETVELAPGGYHIMLLGLTEPLESGDTFDITLDFDTAPDQVVSVQVGDSAPE